MTQSNGIHHLALTTANMKAQIEFFTDVLGGSLVAMYWMHGVEGAWHAFIKLNDFCHVAFVEMPAIHDIEPIPGVTHAGNGGGVCAPGTMQHVAFNVDSDEELLAMRDRIRSRGLNVMGYLDHGMCKSIYFAGPEGLALEVSTSAVPINAEAWIDPEVVALAGISAEELERYKNPAPFQGRGGTLPNPPIDPAKPQMGGYSPSAYQRLMSLPDEVVTSKLSESEPPVKVGA